MNEWKDWSHNKKNKHRFFFLRHKFTCCYKSYTTPQYFLNLVFPMHSFICAIMCSPVSGRNSWLQAGAPSFHGWAPGRCNTPACCPQQPPTPDETPSLGHRYKEGTERNNMRNAHSKIQRTNWKCSLIIMQLCANSFWGGRGGKDVVPTSQVTTTQLGDLHIVEGALLCSGAPGPVVTSYRSESGPNCAHKRTQTIEYNWKWLN